MQTVSKINMIPCNIIIKKKFKGNIAEAIATDQDVRLKILKSGTNGHCDERQQVTFGDNMRSECVLQVPKSQITNSCDQLRSSVLDLLLGPLVRDTDHMIASYGDSDVLHPREWVPLLRATQSRSEDDYQCKN